MKYKQKLQTVEAEKFAPADGKKFQPNDRFQGIPVCFNDKGPNINVGGVVIHEGDFVVTNPDGSKKGVAAEAFALQYEEA